MGNRCSWERYAVDNRGNIQHALNKYNYYAGMVDSTNTAISDEDTKLGYTNADIANLRTIYNNIKGVNQDERGRRIRENLKKYLNKNIKEFIKSYDPTFISNNNKIYLQVTAWNQATKSTHSFDNETFQYTKPPQIFYDTPETEESYKAIMTVEENILDDVFYEPPGGFKKIEVYETNAVLLYNINRELVLKITQPGEYTAKAYSLDTAEKFIGGLHIFPGYRVKVTGAQGVVQTYDNPVKEESMKFIEIDNSILFKQETSDVITELNKYNYIVSKVVVEKME